MIDCTHNAVRVYANSKFLRCNSLALGMFRREKMVIRKVSTHNINSQAFIFNFKCAETRNESSNSEIDVCMNEEKTYQGS